MGEIMCVYVCDEKNSCPRWGLNKILCNLYKTISYIESLPFNMKNIGKVAEMLRELDSCKKQFTSFQWHQYFETVNSYYESILDGNDLQLLDLNFGHNRHELRSLAKSVGRRFKRLKRTIVKIKPRIEYDLANVDKIDGMVIVSQS